METPSEWAKRFNRKGRPKTRRCPTREAETVDSPASVAEFPSEPFQCPACGQLLAPACRVCVACKRTIDPAEIARPREGASPAGTAQDPGQSLCATPGGFSLHSWASSSFLGKSFWLSWGNKMGPWCFNPCRFLPASGCFSMLSGAESLGRCAGQWALCCCLPSSSPGTWPAEKPPNRRCRLWKRRRGPSLVSCFLLCWYLSWRV